MRYAGDSINKALIKLLEVDNQIEYPSGNPIGVYTEVALDSSFPMIVIEPSFSTENDVTKESIDQSYLTNIEVISKFKQGSGGWGTNNSIISQILPLIRNIGVSMDLSTDNFKVVTQIVESIQPIREAYDDAVYFRTIIILETNIQETP